MTQLVDRVLKGILIIVLFSLAVGVEGQTTYYVSNDGDDDALGTSESTAWATISKVNSQSFEPGDSILFERGGIWRNETLIPQSSGTEDNYIVFSSYGSGLKPKIYGSNAITSFTAHPTLANVYQGNGDLPINPNDYDSRSYVGSIYFSIDDSITWGDGLLHYESDIVNLNSNFKWTWQDNAVYFYYDGNINDIDTIECTQIERGISIGTEYLVIDGFDLRYYGSRCIGSSVYPEATRRGMQIRNCHIAYTSAKEDIGFGIALFHSDMIIENNVIHNNGRRNISINITNGTNPVTMENVIIQENELYEGYHTTGVDMGITGYNHTVRNIHIRRNKIWEPYGLDKSHFTSQFIFIYNHGDLEDVGPVYIYNNEFKNVNSGGVFSYGINGAFIVNNTFTATTAAGGFLYSPTGGNSGKYTIMNNAFISHGGNGTTSIEGAGDGTTILDTCDYNLYYAEDNGQYGAYLMHEIDGGNYRFTQWEEIKALGYEHNSLDPQNPHMIDSLYDLRLKSSSPFIGKAKPVSFVTTDIDGNPRDPIAPTIGAYEFMGVDSSATDIYKFTIPNQVSSNINSTEYTINVIMPYGTDVASLTPSIAASQGCVVDPSSGVSQDFSSPVTYSVVSINGRGNQDWVVTVTVAGQSQGNTLPDVQYSLVNDATTRGVVQTIDASSSFDDDYDALSFEWVVPSELSHTLLSESSISILPSEEKTYTIELNVSDGTDIVSKSITIDVDNFNPLAKKLKVVSIEASDYLDENYPENIIDDNFETLWAAEGDGQWLVFELEEPSQLSHFELSFFLGESRQAYFDVFASSDKENWDLILDNSTSCGFSLDLHAFEVPVTKSSESYKYIKLVGHMNSVSAWNSYTEFKIFGASEGFMSDIKPTIADIVEVYPNPSTDFVNIKAGNGSVVRVVDLSGAVLYEQDITSDIAKLNYNFNSGVYFIQISDESSILSTKKLIVK